MHEYSRYARMVLLYMLLPVAWCLFLYSCLGILFGRMLHPQVRAVGAATESYASTGNIPAKSPSESPSPRPLQVTPAPVMTPDSNDTSCESPPGIPDNPDDLVGLRPDPFPRGLLMFRGNPRRTFYGCGPLPAKPVVRWKALIGSCGGWSGTGWTGQPAVVEWPPELASLMFPKGDCPPVEVIVGGLDGKVHFFNGITGKRSRKPFSPPRINNIKGSVVVDPDGYPILYFGNRGGAYWIISLLDFRVLGSVPGGWNPDTRTDAGYWPDFDGSPIIHEGELLLGGENCWLYRIPLRRDLLYTVPESVVPPMKSWKTVYTPTLTGLSRQGLAASGGYASIESSPCLYQNSLYVATGNGMVLGFDCKTLALRFQFYTGDDMDATVVADSNGNLYAAAESDYNSRQRTVIWKLDPSVPLKQWKNAARWTLTFDASPFTGGPGYEDNLDAGIIGTPALGPSPSGEPEQRLYVAVSTKPSKSGRLAAVDTSTGAVIWQNEYKTHCWSSPAVIDGQVLQCDAAGTIHCYNADDGAELWQKPLGGVIESTPAVWKGWIYVGARDGYFYGIADSP